MADADEWIDVTDRYVQQPEEEDGWEDVTSQYVTPSIENSNFDGIEAMMNQPPPENEPGWGETFTTNIGTGAANLVGGVGSLIDALPGFDLGVGEYIKDFAYPYQLGGEQFNQKIPADSWKRTFGNVTQGVSGTLPAIPLGGGTLPGMVGALGVNTFGQTANEVERSLEAQGVPSDEAESTGLGVGALNALIQTPLNAIGMAPIFNKALPMLTRGTYAGAINAPFAVAGAVGDMYARYLGGATDEKPTYEMVKEVAPQAALEGFLGAFGAGTFQAGFDTVADYRSSKAMKSKVSEIQSKIDADMATRQLETPTAPPDISVTEDGFAFSPTGASERVFDQQAAQDFANQQALTKMGVTDPVGAEIAKAEIAKANSHAGKLEAEAKAINEMLPKVEAELESLTKMQEQMKASDPLNAEAFTSDIKQRQETLATSRARLEQVQRELDPAPLNSDPVVAKERMLEPIEEAPTIELNEQLKTEIAESEKILQDENVPIEQKLAVSESLTAKKLELQKLEQEAPLLDNSSNVFPEGITKPNTPEAYAKGVQKDVQAISKKTTPSVSNLDEAIRVRQTTIDDLNRQKDSPNITPEMSQEIASKLEVENAVLKTLQAKKTEVSKELPTTKTIEEGGVKTGSSKAVVSKPKDSEFIEDPPNPFTLTGLKDVIKRIKNEGFRANPEYYKFFVKNWKNPITSQITKSDKYPWFRKSHEASIKHFEYENSLAYDHAQSIRPYQLLNAKEQLETNALAYEAMRRGPEFDASPANLKRLGFSDRVIRGYKAVRDTLDKAADGLRQEAITKLKEDTTIPEKNKPEMLKEINDRFDYMKVSNYVPTGRYGKYGLALWNKDGSLSEYVMSDSKVKLLKTLYAKLRTNSELSAEKSYVAEVPKSVGSEYVGIHPDIVDVLGDSQGHIPNSSFLNRLKRKQLIEGFDEDLGRNLSSYLSSHARYLSTQKLKREYSQNNKDFNAFYEKLGKREKALYSGLKTEIQDLQKFMLTPSDSWNKTSKFFANFYLANNVKTSLVNATSFLTALPNVARYMSAFDNATFQPEWAMAKALKDTAAYYGGKAFRKKEGIVGKDLYASIEQARKEGAIGGSRIMKDLLKDSSRPSPTGNLSKLTQKISDQDVLFLLNSATEDFVRTNSYILGWHAYDKARPYFDKRNIPMPNRHDFAKRFVRETQADYTKAGIPNIARGKAGKLLSTFRLYHHSFFTTLKKSVMEGSFGAGSRYAAILGSIGGVYAIPFISTMLKSAKLAGFDSDKTVEEGVEKIGQGIDYIEGQLPAFLDRGLGKYFQTERGKRAGKYGLLSEWLGTNLSGAISPEIAPRETPGGDVIGMGARSALGVIADPIDRADKFFYFLNEKGDLGRALEQVVPRAFGANDIFSSMRIQKEGLRDASNVNLLTSPTDPQGRMPTEYELWLKRFSFMPMAWSSAYDKKAAEKKIIDENSLAGMYNRIASEMKFGSKERADKLIEEAMSKGADIKQVLKSVMEWDKKMESPEYAQYDRVGKKNWQKAQELNKKYETLIEP